MTRIAQRTLTAAVKAPSFVHVGVPSIIECYHAEGARNCHGILQSVMLVSSFLLFGCLLRVLSDLEVPRGTNVHS